ncbi:MAG: DUF6301 family protein [Propionicimonas sp.]
MVTIRQVSSEDLQRIIDVFAGVAWPLPMDDVPALAERLGWTPWVFDNGETMPGRYNNGLPVSWPQSNFGSLKEGDPSLPAQTAIRGGEMSVVDLGITDDLEDVGPVTAEARRSLREAYDMLVKQVDLIMGVKSAKSSYGTSRMWDLPNGGRIHVVLIADMGVNLKVSSKWMADLERAEAHHDEIEQPD